MIFMINERKGEITAFLSLILLLILSLIGTIIEGARVNVAKAYASRALITSMDSILGEYFYPLYEDYHLFFLDGGYGTKNMDTSQMIEIMEEYMDFSFHSSKEYKVLGQSVPMASMNLYDITIDHITIEDTVVATDFENKMFIHEAVGYMKYMVPANLIETTGEKYTNSKATVQASDIMEKKMNLEEKACILSESMLDLIRYIEGISVDKKGIHYSNNLIKTENNFVKKFCVGSVDKNSLVISHDIVFEALKNRYNSPIAWVNTIIAEENNIKNYLDRIEELRYKLESLSSENDEWAEKQKDIIRSQINSLEKKKQKALQKVELYINQLLDLTKGTENKIKEALGVIPKISQNQIEASIEAKNYEEYLDENKANIDKDLFSNLEKDSGKIQDYINDLGEKEEYNLSKNRLDTIQIALTHNNQVLKEVYGIKNIPVTDSKENIDSMITFTTHLKTILSTYNIKDLWFDYSSLKIDPDVKNPVTHYKKLMEQGVLNLVVKDLSSISQKEIISPNLPSQINSNEVSNNMGEDLSGNISDCDEEGYNADLKNSFGEYANEGKTESNNIGTSNQLLELVLLNEYMLEHFKNQGNLMNKKILKETVLKYEQEYLLNGNMKDYDNYRDMVFKLIFTRTLMNFMFLFTDSEKSGLAYATAASLVGFTCLEPLISLTKTVILLVWAYEEALVDVCGLLENKYVPFLKSKDSFVIGYNELLLINKDLIQERAKILSTKKGAPIDMSYDEYIRIFLYLTNQNTKCKRAMDLIQENMRMKYEENFLIQNCIFSYKVKADFKIGAKFIKLPFVNKELNSTIDEYEYSITRDFSY